MSNEDQVSYLRVNIVARRTGLKCRTIRHHATHGNIRAFKIGKLWFFLETDVNAFIAKRECDYV
jgi:excisionase family DNA binding protein